MEWLIHLENYNISFNIKHLNKDDYIIANQEVKNCTVLYILDGFMQKTQIFTNGEIICLRLLYKNNIFTNIKPNIKKPYQNINYHYSFQALINTTIIAINREEFINKIPYKDQDFKETTNIYYNYEGEKEMINILSHKNTRRRLIQLLLTLIEHFGIFTKYSIVIPFNLSHHNIATIIGSQRVTVNKIMNILKKNS